MEATRREVLAALTAIPGVASVARLDMDVARDALVVSVDRPISVEARDLIKRQLREVLGADVKVLVLSYGITLSVLKQQEG